MSVDQVAVTLLAMREDRKNIAEDEFISRLKFDALKEPFSTRSDAGVGVTSAVNVLPVSVEEFAADREEMSESFDKRLGHLFLNIAQWLESIPKSVFDDMNLSGLTVWLFVDLVLSDNQIELHLPPRLLAACARLNLEIDINSY